MKKQAHKTMKQIAKLLTIMGAVALLSISFYITSKLLKPYKPDTEIEEMQTDEMINYQKSEGRTDLLFF